MSDKKQGEAQAPKPQAPPKPPPLTTATNSERPSNSGGKNTDR